MRGPIALGVLENEFRHSVDGLHSVVSPRHLDKRRVSAPDKTCRLKRQQGMAAMSHELPAAPDQCTNPLRGRGAWGDVA